MHDSTKSPTLLAGAFIANSVVHEVAGEHPSWHVCTISRSSEAKTSDTLNNM
jgi:hypothetical protein